MVYKAIQLETRAEVAVKILTDEDSDDIDREISLLVKLLSPFIVSFIEAIKWQSQIWVKSIPPFPTVPLNVEIDCYGVL